MEPLRLYLASQFNVASEKWELLQQSRLAAALAAGSQRLYQARQYRLGRLASGVEDTKFFEQIRKLFQPGLWTILPPKCLTVSFRSLLFRAISREGCSFERTLAPFHRSLPIKIFGLLADPTGTAEELGALPPCMWDAWSSDLIAGYSRMDDPMILHILFAIAVLVWVDISTIEAKHASVRRLATALSVQCPAIDFGYLSSLFFLGDVRRRRRPLVQVVDPQKKKLSRPNGRGRVRKTIMQRPASNLGPKGRRGGGAWRGWVRLRRAGQVGRGSLADLAVHYHIAKAARTPEYLRALEMGKAATLAGRGNAPGASSSAFGPTQRSLAARRQDALVRHALTHVQQGRVFDSSLAAIA
eukprot:3366883-Pyramimonas_sp.AAC.1